MDFTGAKLPCFSIGTSIRNSQAFNKNPGPGAHEALENSLMGRKKSPRATIGNSTREEFNKKKHFPGPANYSPHRDISDCKQYSQKIAMLGRKFDMSSKGKIGCDSPGPIYNTGKSTIFTSK
tara:strand:- start:327 stop:692 length:366 start_codon:yes stop_codon:yes gene_type:complete